MSIGSTIKRMRRERDITQEQLAEYIGISSQAVSQWECDKTAPDITQLPLLAYIFDVTTDEILDVDQKKNEERISEIIEESQIPYGKGDYHETVKLLKKGLREFPKSYRIMERLANALPSIGECREAIELCEKIIAECTDTDLRDGALQTMIYTYSNIGDNDNALRCARKTPHMWFSREIYLTSLLNGEGEDDIKGARENLVEVVNYMADQLAISLRRLADTKFGYTDDERLTMLRQATEIIKKIYCDGDYYFSSQFPAYAYGDMADIYASRCDVENTISCLEEECRFRVMFVTYEKYQMNTSPGVRGYKDGGWIEDSDGNLANDMMNRLNGPAYEFVRTDKRFGKVIETLREYAK